MTARRTPTVPPLAVAVRSIIATVHQVEATARSPSEYSVKARRARRSKQQATATNSEQRRTP